MAERYITAYIVALDALVKIDVAEEIGKQELTLMKEYTLQIGCLGCGRDEIGSRELEVEKPIKVGCDTCRDEVATFTPTSGNYHDVYHGNRLIAIIECTTRVTLRNILEKARREEFSASVT